MRPAAVRQARDKTSHTGQATDAAGNATLQAGGTERALVIALQGIRAAAKQQRRMWAGDDDPATNFSLEGYLIGQRLNPNRATLLQNADALAKAHADDLPGYEPATGIQTVADALTAYRNAEGGQQDTEEERGRDKLERDRLVKKISRRRMATQHAADALWPLHGQNQPPRAQSLRPAAEPALQRINRA